MTTMSNLRHPRVIDVSKLVPLDTFAQLPVLIAVDGHSSSVGKGLSPTARARSAYGERLERRILKSVQPRIRAAAGQLGDSCVAPPELGLDLPDERPNLVRPYSPDQPVGWIPATSLDGESRWIHHPGWERPGFQRPTSNGTALAPSRAAALDAAVAELLERHAFVSWWYRFTKSRPIVTACPTWWQLAAWFGDLGWDLTAHLLPSDTQLPVVLAAALRRDSSGAARESIIGLSAGAGGQSLGDIMCSAASEIIQALEAFSVREAVGCAPVGDLAVFLTPPRATDIDQRLQGSEPVHGDLMAGSRSPVVAARDAGLRIWRTELAGALKPDPLYCIQVFSPDTLPYPSTGRGRRLDHPILRRSLTKHGRAMNSIPSLPHPLG